MASPPALPVLTARLGWIAEVAASTEHHAPPPATRAIGARGRAATTRTRRNWPCFLATSTRSLTGSGRPRSVLTWSSSASSASSRTGRSASSSCLPNRYGYAIPAIAAPISGASQNTQSCAGAPLPLKNVIPRRARRVDRRGGDQVDQGEGKADGQTGESLGRPDLRLHDLRHSGAVLAALTGPTLAADGLPGSLPPRRQRCAFSTPPRSATRSSRRRAPGWPGASSAAREIAHYWSFFPTSAIDLAPARSRVCRRDSCRPVHRLRAEPSAIDLRRRAAPPVPVGQSPPRLYVWPLSARIAGDTASRLSDCLGWQRRVRATRLRALR